MSTVPGVYRDHTGNLFVLLSVACYAGEEGRRGEPMVVYQALQPTHGGAAVSFVRPLSEWEGAVDIKGKNGEVLSVARRFLPVCVFGSYELIMDEQEARRELFRRAVGEDDARKG